MNKKMIKDDVYTTEGTVTNILPNALFKVSIADLKDQKNEMISSNNTILLCHLSGKMRINSIKLVLGDRVRIEISKYDLTKGRIIKRL